MVHKFLKGYLFAAILFSNFLMFADDDPGSAMEDESGNTEGSVETGLAPINGWMIYMLLLGIAFAFYYFKKQKQQKAA